MCEKQVSVDSRTKIYIETALINYANSGNCDIMYIPRCVGMVIICGIKACSRYNVLSAAVPGPKAPKAGRSPARDLLTKLKRHKIIKKLSKSVDKRGILGYNNTRRR